tara:strand:- start:36004 stop:37116 length:1113 start_codon:yes stop_codon:yes gene_type:complete
MTLSLLHSLGNVSILKILSLIGNFILNQLILKYNVLLLTLAVLFSPWVVGKESTGDTLKIIKERGHLICGVSQGLPGFSNTDDQGQWQGLDVDFCRGVAAAVFADKNKVKFIPLSAKERFTALQSGEIDILARNTTWTFIRDATLGLDFIGVFYYDGQGFMVKKDLGVKSVNELGGAIICTNAGTTTELNIADYFQTHGLKYQIVTFEKSDETVTAYEAGRCDVFSTDKSGLYSYGLQLKNKKDHVILPEIISKEPLGPVVRQGDDQWANIVRWTLFSLINAEELKLTQANIKEKLNSQNPNIQRFVGSQGAFGQKIGLSNDWAYQIILQVGNYNDIFDRNLGTQTPLKVERGMNRLWTEGGILYAPPLR